MQSRGIFMLRILTVVSLAAAAPAIAQFSSDPADQLAIAGSGPYQSQVRAGPAGGYYIAYSLDQDSGDCNNFV